jgi:hypothetical protein
MRSVLLCGFTGFSLAYPSLGSAGSLLVRDRAQVHRRRAVMAGGVLMQLA